MNATALDMSLTDLHQQCADVCVVLSAVTGCPERLARLRPALDAELGELTAKAVRARALLHGRDVVEGQP